MAAKSKTSKGKFESPAVMLLASLADLQRKRGSKTAHSYRTSLRRFQAWSDVYHPQVPSAPKQVLAFLDKLRKRTGKLRDSHVHLRVLNEMKDANKAEKVRLEKYLKAQRRSAKKKVKALLEKTKLPRVQDAMRGISEQFLQTQQSANAHPVADMAALALEEYRAFVQGRGNLNAETLHEYRLACKRFRYTAELAGDNREGQRLTNVWKSIQDVTGDWHDLLVLAQIAEKALGNSNLHSLLVQRTEEKYRESLRAVEEAERQLIEPDAQIPKKEPIRTRAGQRSPAVA